MVISIKKMNEFEKRLLKVQYLLPEELRNTNFTGNFHRFVMTARLCLRYSPQVDQVKILDIGCGIGTFALMLKELGFTVYCVEHPDVPDRQWLLDNKIETRRAVLEDQSIPFEDNSFHIITCLGVIEHLHGSPKKMLGEIKRLLVNNGVVIIQGPNFVNLRKRIDVLLGRTNHVKLDYFFNHEYPYISHVREFTPSEMITLLELSNFNPIFKCMNNFHLKITKLKNCPEPINNVSYKFKYKMGFKFNSPGQILKMLYGLAVALVPNWRDTVTVVGAKS
jgi:2-polyprenyl-3-methyl-5-hydroxy-6-metoxy-1,4-benzoquinol methylase